MKKGYFVAAFLTAAFVLFSGGFIKAEVISVPNGGFELADENGQPMDWLVDVVDPEDNQIQVDTKVYHSGKASLYFEKGCSPKDYEGTPTPWKGSWMYMRGTEFALPKPGRYIISFWAKQGDGPGNFWLVIYKTDTSTGGKKQLTDDKGTYVIVATDKSGEWKFYEKVLDIPQEFTTLGFQPQIRDANKVWVDDVKVEPFEEEEE